MSCFVISLNNVLDRREHIKKEFEKATLAFQFFDALRPKEGKEFLVAISPNCDLTLLSPGEIACLASHIALWKKLIESKDEYLIAFEDDVFLGEGIADFLCELSINLKDIDLVKLETFQEKVLLGKAEKHVSNRSLHDLRSNHSGTAGYLITRSGATKLLNFLFSEKQIMPADHYMFEETLRKKEIKVIQVLPGLCIQEKVLFKECSLSNSLDQARNSWTRIKRKRSIWIKIYRELHRFILRHKLKIFSTIVEFK